MKSYVPQIINTILQVGTVHYSDIEKLTGKSKKTVAKYLDEVEETIRDYDVRLVRKRNVGVYFEGDTKRLAAAIGEVGLLNEQGSKHQRHLSLISKLLLTKQAQRIQDLADDSYVSRSTFEADLRDARIFLEKYGAQLQTNNEGIQIVASERVRRRLMAELLNLYWGQPAYIGNRRANTHKQIQVPGEISEFFSRATLDKVLSCLDEFEKQTHVGLSDYEYQSLAVHLVIAIGRIKRDEVLKGIPEQSQLEAATETLSAIIEQSFAITIPDDEKQYLNIHVLAAEENVSNKTAFDSQSVTPKDNAVSDFLRASLTQYDEILIHNLTLQATQAFDYAAVVAAENDFLAANVAYQRQQFNLFANRLDNKIWPEDSAAKLPAEQSVFSLPSTVNVAAIYPAFTDAKSFIVRVVNLSDHAQALPAELKDAQQVDGLEKAVAAEPELGRFAIMSFKLPL